MIDQETKTGWKTADWLSAQVSVLGSVLLKADHWAGEVVSRTAPVDYSDTYRPVFEVIRQKYQAGETIDPVTVKHALGPGAGELLMQIMEYTPTSATCGEYIDLMLEQSRLRQLEGLARRMMEAVNLEEAQDLLDQANALACRREKVRVVTMRETGSRQSRPLTICPGVSSPWTGGSMWSVGTSWCWEAIPPTARPPWP